MAEIRDQYGRDITSALQAADAPAPGAGPYGYPSPSGEPTGRGGPAAPAPATPRAEPAPSAIDMLEAMIKRVEALEAQLVRIVSHIFGAQG